MTEQYDKVEGLGKDLTDEEKATQERVKTREEEKKVVNRVISGHNDVFNKHYKFEEMDLNFDISIKFPNIVEQARIQAKTERYFDGLGSLMPARAQQAYRILATMRICGKDIPGFLKEDEQIYNLHIFNVIGDDFIDWMNSFQY